MARLKYAMNHGNALVMMTSSSCFGALEAKYFSNWNGWFYIQARRTPKYIRLMNKMFADITLTVANTKVKIPKIHHWRMGSKAKSAPWNRFPNQKVFTDDRMWGNDYVCGIYMNPRTTTPEVWYPVVKLLFKWVSSGAFDWEEEAHLELADKHGFLLSYVAMSCYNLMANGYTEHPLRNVHGKVWKPEAVERLLKGDWEMPKVEDQGTYGRWMKQEDGTWDFILGVTPTYYGFNKEKIEGMRKTMDKEFQITIYPQPCYLGKWEDSHWPFFQGNKLLPQHVPSVKNAGERIELIPPHLSRPMNGARKEAFLPQLHIVCQHLKKLMGD
ncbi:hypothetical protein [Klebsiella pneumoniae]|uniref:hypothetical protein n=1 Tax=Klebsiella pneumoniae TaxID=573 RepID=UPI00137664FB|nr:hypothetical protein [Klebsiella pneumoniae]